jgi:hypothetical protein
MVMQHAAILQPVHLRTTGRVEMLA